MEKPDSDKYSYNRFGSKGKRVGQAVVDILSKPQPIQTVGDTLDAFGPDFAKQIEQCIEDNKSKYKNPFYIFVLTKKEFWANNVVRNWFIARQTAPHAFDMMEQYSNYTKTLYIVDSAKGNIKCLWSLPGWDDCLTIAKAPQKFDPELVKWVEGCFTRQLDRDEYPFDWQVA
jgi:hypothetical protein